MKKKFLWRAGEQEAAIQQGGLAVAPTTTSSAAPLAAVTSCRAMAATPFTFTPFTFACFHISPSLLTSLTFATLPLLPLRASISIALSVAAMEASSRLRCLLCLIAPFLLVMSWGFSTWWNFCCLVFIQYFGKSIYSLFSLIKLCFWVVKSIT